MNFQKKLRGLNVRKQDLEDMIAKDEQKKRVLTGMLKTTQAKIVKERRLKMRKQGGGRSQAADG